MIRDNMTLPEYLIELVKYQSLSLPWAFTISAPPVKETKLHERFHIVTKP